MIRSYKVTYDILGVGLSFSVVALSVDDAIKASNELCAKHIEEEYRHSVSDYCASVSSSKVDVVTEELLKQFYNKDLGESFNEK